MQKSHARHFISILLILLAGNAHTGHFPELSRTASPSHYFDQSGKRVIFAGHEDGSGELWSPPYQLLSSLEVVDQDGKRAIPPQYRITPACSEMTFDEET